MIIDEINIKLIVLGLGGVGKTSLIHGSLGKEIPDPTDYQPTIGSNIYRREYLLKDKNIKIRINIWDIGGQRSFNPFSAVIYNDVDIILLVFDLFKPKESLDEIKNFYLNNIIEYTGKSTIFLIGNKLDLIHEKDKLTEITEKTIAEEIPLVFLSALTSENVIDSFDLFIYKFLQEWEKDIKDNKFKGTTEEFLKYIDKNGNELERLFVNIKNVDSVMLQKHSIPQVKKKVVSEADIEKEKGLKEYIEKRNEIRELRLIKADIIYKFTKNMIEIQDLINNLKSTPIDSLIETIDSSLAQLDILKEDFELSLESIINLDIDKIEQIEKVKDGLKVLKEP